MAIDVDMKALAGGALNTTLWGEGMLLGHYLATSPPRLKVMRSWVRNNLDI